MTKFKDYRGQKFGRLECLSLSEPSRVNGETRWKCKCDCGKIVDVNIASVAYGNTRSCGCLRNTARDYAGQKFGCLECIAPSEPVRVNNATYWKCRCDCGTIADFNMGNVISGKTSSCGCLRNTFNDYTGQKFGCLECISFVERVNNATYWKCKCDCGKIVDVNIASVVYGSTRSCGCLRNIGQDYTGQKFGRLECLSPSEPARVNGKTYWKCKCDCGNIVDVNIQNVVRGSRKACGCLRNVDQDYTGQKFGHLECISFVERVNGIAYWKCKCKCGKIVDVNIKSLASGNKKSCGCLRKKTPPFKDYTGRKFGRLECISFVEKVNGITYWKCKCDCGNIVDVSIVSVVSGSRKSCGCLGNSGQDYTGKKFGRLECLSPSEPSRVNGKNFWQCKCDCGKIVDVNIGSIVSGGTRSCGCLKKSRDYTGQKFGRLECISPSEPERVHGKIFWKCKCDCGKIIDVHIGSVVSGVKKSCGCSRRSVESKL